MRATRSNLVRLLALSALIAGLSAVCDKPEKPEPPPPPPQQQQPPDGGTSTASDGGEDAGTAEPDAAVPCQEPAREGLSEEEWEVRRALACTGIFVRGQVVANASGAALAGARVAIAGQEVRTDSSGHFMLLKPRRNALLEVEAGGHRKAVLALELRRPLEEPTLDLGRVALTPLEEGATRMLFGGDLSLGRRFLDPDESTPRDQLPPDDSTAWVRVSDPIPGSREAMRWVAPYFAAVDFRVLNLETPVTDNVSTPHRFKDFAFFTLPGSLEALKVLGVQYVSLGNNHVYDYLEVGLTDTLRHLRAQGLGFSGAGGTPQEAFVPWRTRLGNQEYSFISATSIAGNEHSVAYVASSGQGGAADLRDDRRVASAVGGEKANGAAPIALLHMGIEYAEGPQGYSLGRIRHVISSGASLVVAHHPHVPQGIGWHDGVLAAHSLGNFAFDQDRLETMLGALLQVDLRGRQLLGAQVLPLYLEDYRPRPVTGWLAERLLRGMAEASLPHGGRIAISAHRGQVLLEGQQRTTARRTVTVPVEVSDRGWAVLDLRAHLRPGEALSAATLEGSGALRPGADVLFHGDFEDHDVDEEQGELPRWELSAGSSFLCYSRPHAGVAALCSTRREDSRSASLVSFRNRVRVPGDGLNRPNKRLTLVAWARGENAGPSSLDVTYYASEGDAEFGSATALTTSGSFDWRLLSADLQMPADPPSPDPFSAARALRIFIRQRPPSSGTGLLSVDDLAVVAWDPNADAQLKLETPNTRDFLRVEAGVGTHQVTLELERDETPAR